MNKRFVTSALSVVSAAVVLLAGCGGGAQPDAAGGAAAPSANQVKFAYTMPLTGDKAEYGVHFSTAAEIATEMINQSGGINGKELVVDIYDSKGDPKESTEIARKVTQDPSYIAALGDFTSSSAMAAAPIYEEAGMVHLSPTASNPDFVKMGDYQFAMYGTQADDAPYAAEYVIQKYLNHDSVALIYLNTDWGLSALKYFEERAKEIGLKITAKEPIAEGEKDFTAILSKLKKTNPDCIYIMAYATEVANATIQARTSGWDIPIIPSSSAVTDQLIDMMGAYAEGLVTNQVYLLSEEDKPVWDFAQEFEKRAGIPATYFSFLAYDAVWGLAEAARYAGDNLTREAVKDQLKALDIDTLLGRLKFDEEGNLRRQYKIVGYQNGRWVELAGYDFMEQ